MTIKALLREIFALVIVATGTARAMRALLWRDRVAILTYHDPAPETLDQHLTYLRRVCDVVQLDELAQPGTGHPRAVITLDDGHAGNAKLLPVFIKHNVRPTIFLCSGIVGRARRHWWLHPAARTVGIDALKMLGNAQRLATLEKYGYQPNEDDEATGLSVDQLKAMHPFVDFQSHTRFHPILTRCEDDACEDEIFNSKREIEMMLGTQCEHFAYPNGNYGDREVRLLETAGYKTGRTCDVGWNDARSDRFRLRSIVIADDASTRWFAAQLTGIPLFIRYLRGGAWSGRQRQS
ncbi:polysaccharide deacetylase family protein [Paraburkholderia sp.]|jgi:peptidoglycan/xylan/chitin deacetylase (PgdA/CDA1 family)|uniref:polysaccharide deacetylase family protein n=1 Tax=Paraburkholderia sp. TaxID=1926495 RepID=UPI003C53AB79